MPTRGQPSLSLPPLPRGKYGCDTAENGVRKLREPAKRLLRRNRPHGDSSNHRRAPATFPQRQASKTVAEVGGIAETAR